jgi:GH35 family endo-1,4-beta-xylanase
LGQTQYGTENDPPVRNTYKIIINLLKTRGLIDGIGIQAILQHRQHES